jgi:hypothetical protein
MRGDGQRADGGVGIEKVPLWRVSSRGGECGEGVIVGSWRRLASGFQSKA